MINSGEAGKLRLEFREQIERESSGIRFRRTQQDAWFEHAVLITNYKLSIYMI